MSADQGPTFEPWERLMLLSNAADDIPEELGGEAIRAVCGAAMATVRHLLGKTTSAEAIAHITRARIALEEARTSRRDEPEKEGPSLTKGGPR
jgi:hypothetical protein